MNILVVGGGGREHAFVWKLKQSPHVEKIFVASGNAGTAGIATNLPISKTGEILQWLQKNPVELVLIGPDNYLAEGIVDSIQKLGIPVFGPTKAAAEIEWSKSFAKQLMRDARIPTASFETFTDLEIARTYVRKQVYPLVIKASGLAFGKGVVIVETSIEAEKVLEEIMGNKIFGSAGSEVVIEEFLQGTEISIHAFCDGEDAVLFPSSQDHKRIFDGDKGPNTGGIGTIAPVPRVTAEQMQEIKNKIVLPTLAALKEKGREFKGLLYPGIMLTASGPKVIEFNARFGDPETQVYMRLLETDLVDILFACIKGTLQKQKIVWSNKFTCCVVLSSGGYPDSYQKGKVIKGLNHSFEKDIVIFHAGTTMKNGEVITNGGRVLGVSATGSNLSEALSKAYDAITYISFEGMQYRKDIGAKAVKRS